MTLPTDAAIARAFHELSRRTSIGQPWALDYFVLMVNRCAEQFDAEAGGTDRQPDEICEPCGYVRGSLGCDDAHKKREKVTTSPERVQIPADTERGYCPLCTGNVWKGRYCSGPKCPLRPA